jgi:N-acetylmuramoyl-L-alanine amidase
MKAQQIKYIVIHCQAGNGTLESMKAFWKNSLGWNAPGYHTWIDYTGTPFKLAPFTNNTNGVKGFNSQCINICYRGGVEPFNIKIAKDTRTSAQKMAILNEILGAIKWLSDNGNDLQNVMIVGHYQFSDDQNKNGTIEPWERIKECPSFDAYAEYKWIMEKENALYHKLKLPKNR